ncbi:hypothetical protein AA101099_1089 [Neoasaia chiangmaiensis NBRC 101099]|uniref:Uncharacterized protein n=1 Tax=Neoasaia chiangmaiensis TaxID=320497 RepID=A0A1U9KMY4_9PROT|nr:glycine betaine ABC transporter substrate-binding protein [Neoasaia chiangmaiensis]AQS87161.1 hypothetical protein A0U93_03540 [Neoasaia chiangmaiensis]GBR38195.1 hypothetical protein AA101099_1089 [Neoasaia chiangmaiensis NBRC 101099]GEN15995.1 glycine/betaine ABC transporter substrate-binding protein [Neoasaia chiangmaiensis]
MNTITLGHLRDTLHAGCASAVARVLDAYEMDVSFVDASPEELPDLLAEGEIDLLVSAWMPRDRHLARGMREIGQLYLPVYVWAATKPVGDIETLGAQEIARIVTTPPNVARLRDALANLPALQAVPVDVVDDDDIFDHVAGLDAGATSLVVLAQPHALFHTDMLHVVNDPAHRLGAEMEARMLVRDATAACVDSDMIDELSEMMLGNKVMSALDYAIRVENVDPEEAAEAWQRGRLLPR